MRQWQQQLLREADDCIQLESSAPQVQPSKLDSLIRTVNAVACVIVF